MKTLSYLLHALSPLHAGTGQSEELIDLPIARMKGTGIPFLPGSSAKGVLRDAAGLQVESGTMGKDEFFAVFGPETADAADHAGALICADARLLALPVLSFRGTFAYVTSPLLLHLASRDLPGNALPIPPLADGFAAVPPDSVLPDRDRKIYLEDLDLQIDGGGADAARQCAETLAGLGVPLLKTRLAIVDDATMAFLWETATQIDMRNRLDSETRTVARGALWMEESLPAETLLIGLLAAEPKRRREVHLTADEVLEHVLPKERILQFGGKATIGRGRCRMIPILGNRQGACHGQA